MKHPDTTDASSPTKADPRLVDFFRLIHQMHDKLQDIRRQEEADADCEGTGASHDASQNPTAGGTPL